MSVPRPKTRFFGRARDLARVATVRSGIVTLWGPPGIGKTRLAIEACNGEALAHAGEKWFCDLSGARDAAGICEAVCRSLEICGGATPTRAWIGAALASREGGVLVLDGFEHLTAHAAETVATWADVAPQVLFLVTSRARLRLEGEHALELQRLDEASALFVDRAGASDLDDDAVADLVDRLEGNPLAVELAAARLDMFGLAELTRRLANPLEMLGNGAGTLRRAIDSSVRLLPPAARRALTWCAVFRGGFSLEAAESVLGERADVLEHLQALRDASLLRCERDEREVRFALFDAVREHALALLEADGDATEARRRHARHFLDAPHEDDDANVEEAAAFELRADVDAPRLAQILRVLVARDASGASESFSRMLARAVELAGRLEVGPSLRARAQHALGCALQMQGHLREARDALDRAAELAGDDSALVAEIATAIGLVHHQLRELDRAREQYDRALTALGESGPPVARARCIGNLGAVHHDARRYDDALEHYQSALALLRVAHEPRLEGIFLANLGVLQHERGAAARARANFELALERLAATNDRRFEAITRTNLGMLLHETGAVVEARAEHQRALQALRRIIDPRSEALCLGRLAMAHAAMGDHALAEKDLRRAYRIVAGLEDPVAGAILSLFHTYVELACGADEALVRERLADARAPVWAGGASILDLSDDARSAARLIEARLARRGDAREAVLVVGPEAVWFRPPDGSARELGNRKLLRRLLLRLVVQHRNAPGEGLSLDALRAAGWPDDRSRSDAAANRIHVALTELRRRGLRACLVRREAQYLIDPAVRVELSDG